VTASSPNTLKKMLLSWPLADQRRFFEDEVGIPLKLEPETGKLFPVSDRARDVRDGLVGLARERGARFRFEARVTGLEPGGGIPWVVVLSDGERIAASAVVLASGGLSVPKTGSDGTGLRIVRGLGHTVHDTYPALTPLTSDPPRHAPLAGVSLEVTLRAPQERGVFSTRRLPLHAPGVQRPLGARRLAPGGALGPGAGASAADPGAVDGAGRRGLGGAADGGGRRDGRPLVRRALPDRLAEALLAEAGVAPDRRLSQLRREERARLVEALTAYPLPWTGDEGYKKAEVTGGGVSLARSIPARWRAGSAPGSSSAARSSTPSARSAATTSPGPGRPAAPPGSGSPDARPERAAAGGGSTGRPAAAPPLPAGPAMAGPLLATAPTTQALVTETNGPRT
jgi:hypothetical protein